MKQFFSFLIKFAITLIVMAIIGLGVYYVIPVVQYMQEQSMNEPTINQLNDSIDSLNSEITALNDTIKYRNSEIKVLWSELKVKDNLIKRLDTQQQWQKEQITNLTKDGSK